MIITSKMWRVLTWFSFNLVWWPSFDPKWPSFELDLKTKTNILSKIHDDHSKDVTSRVITRFSFDLAQWPSFWPKVTHFQTWPRNHQDKYFEQDAWLLKYVISRVLTRFSFNLAWWPSFSTQVIQFEPDLEIIKANFLSKSHDDHFKNVWSLQRCVNNVFLWFNPVT